MNSNFIKYFKKDVVKIQNDLEIYKICSFYYFSNVKNVESIIRHGILPYNEIKRQKIYAVSFANEKVQERRDEREIFSNKENTSRLTIHDVTPVYFTPRTPTLYAVCKRQAKERSQLVFFVISIDVLFDNSIYFFTSDGNAASGKTIFYFNTLGFRFIDWELINSGFWAETDDGKRRMCAEILFYPYLPSKYIKKIIFPHNSLLQDFNKMNVSIPSQIHLEADSRYFF